MTLDMIAVVPGIASALLISVTSVQTAFFRLYLPVLLLLPDNYSWGWPPLCFHQYAIVPIGLTLCWWVVNGKWRLSWVDVGVFGFVVWVIASDIHGNGTADIVNRFLTPITLAAFPYMAGKLLIEQTGLRMAIAQRFAFLLFVDVLISAYEFRFAVNPFRQVFGRWFSSPNPWFTQLRYGFGRISGPFGHAILMGAVVAAAILLHRYTMRSRKWDRRFKLLPNWPLNKQWIILAGLIAGSLMTLSRGPWIAAIIGAMVASVGVARFPARAFRRILLLLVAGCLLGYVGGKAYVAGSKSYGGQEEVASAEYRTELLQEYGDIARQRSFWGWGSLHWPRVAGMDSVDNWYLLLAIMHGIPGLVLFVFMLSLPIIQLVRTGLSGSGLTADERALMFTLCGILSAIAVDIATVYLGGQMYPILFLFLGWSDACLSYRQQRVMSAAPAFGFRKVIA